MKTKYLLMLSEIIDRMDIREDLQNLDFNTGDEKADREKLGTTIITILITKLYKCPKEFYTFVASFKNYYPEKPIFTDEDTEETRKSKMIEYQKAVQEALKKAENEDIIEVFKEISKTSGFSSFLSIA